MSFNRRAGILFFTLGLLVALAPGAVADAATLRIQPTSGNFKVGETLNATLVLDSVDQPVNALEGAVTYPTDLVSLKSINTAGGIISIWVQDPKSGTSGKVSFSGGILKPGFKGSGGKVLNLTFSVIDAGTGAIRIANGAVLAADGEGTNVLDNLEHFTFTAKGIGAESAPPITPPRAAAIAPITPGAPTATTTTGGTEGAPTISSPTHPDPRLWYRQRNFVAEWPLDSKVIGISRRVDQAPGSNPGPKSDGFGERAEFVDLPDGISYFHVKFIYADESFSPITHFPLRVDATAPTDVKVQVLKNETRFKQPVLEISANDATSGVAYYEIELGAAARFTIEATERRFTLPIAQSGTYAVTVRAFDWAGNSAEKSITVVVNVLEAPVIIQFPATPLLGDPLEVNGQAEPQALVSWRYSATGSAETVSGLVQANEKGFWRLSYAQLLAPGKYDWRFSQRTILGVESAETEPMSMEVINFVRLGGLAVPLKTLIAFSILLLTTLSITVVASTRAFRRARLRAVHEALAIEERVHLELEDLQSQLLVKLEHLKHLKNERALSRAEADIEKTLKEAIKHIKARGKL